MATKKKEKFISEYLVDVINNGVVVEDMASHTIKCECCKEVLIGDRNTAIYQLLGKYLWREIRCTGDEPPVRFKVTITVEER